MSTTISFIDSIDKQFASLGYSGSREKELDKIYELLTIILKDLQYDCIANNDCTHVKKYHYNNNTTVIVIRSGKQQHPGYINTGVKNVQFRFEGDIPIDKEMDVYKLLKTIIANNKNLRNAYALSLLKR